MGVKLSFPKEELSHLDPSRYFSVIYGPEYYRWNGTEIEDIVTPIEGQDALGRHTALHLRDPQRPGTPGWTPRGPGPSPAPPARR